MPLTNPKRATRRASLALLTLVVAGSAHAFSPLLTSDSVRAFRDAVSDMKKGQAGRGSAVLNGLLMSRQVKIGIDSGSIPSGREQSYSEGVRQGLDTWDRSIDDSPFVMAQPGEKPDVVVRFVRNVPEGGEVQGVIDVKRKFAWGKGGSRYTVDGAIRIKDNAYGRTLSGVQVGRILSHELGHLLGLNDDYAGRGVMASFRSNEGRIAPTDAEIDAVAEFRGELREALRLVNATR